MHDMLRWLIIIAESIVLLISILAITYMPKVKKESHMT